MNRIESPVMNKSQRGRVQKTRPASAFMSLKDEEITALPKSKIQYIYIYKVLLKFFKLPEIESWLIITIIPSIISGL